MNTDLRKVIAELQTIDTTIRRVVNSEETIILAEQGQLETLPYRAQLAIEQVLELIEALRGKVAGDRTPRNLSAIVSDCQLEFFLENGEIKARPWTK